MARKYLLFVIFVMLISISAVSAGENSTDEIAAINCNDEVVDLDDNLTAVIDSNEGVVDSDDNLTAASGSYDDGIESDIGIEDYDVDKAVLKPYKLTTTYDSGKTFNVKVVSAHDKSFALEDVKLKLRVYTHGKYKDYYALTNNNGIAKFKVSKIALGTHNVAIFSANPYTNAQKVTSKIIIKKVTTSVYAPKITAKYKHSKTFKIKIKDKATKKAVKNVKITVKIGKKKYTLKTNGKGVAIFKTKNLKSGTYKVTIKSKNSKYIINAKSVIKIKSVQKKKPKSSSKSKSGGGNYIGNSNTKKFHCSSCSYVKKMSSSNKVYLTRNQAINWGYVPCKKCCP